MSQTSYEMLYERWNGSVAECDALRTENERLRAEKNAAYNERDRLVAMLSAINPAWLERHPDSDTDWEDDWRWIVFVHPPSCGQLSWHIHDSELDLFDHLERREGNSWDGHSTTEKYQRIENFVRESLEEKP